MPLPQSAGKSGQTASAEAPNWNLNPLHSPDRDVARRTFLRMVSHELRTPLNSIIGFAEILRQELYGPLGSPNYVEYAGIIQDSGKKLLALFNNFIEIVRLESGGDLVAAPNPVLAALEDAVSRVRPFAVARGVSIRIRLLDEDLEASFDPRGLASCLDQLLHNAIDFTREGEDIELDVATGDTVEISIFNRGPAPDSHELERLMLPFEQGNAEISRPRQGAGLGWAIVRLNAEAMGGYFRVETRKGEWLNAILGLKAG